MACKGGPGPAPRRANAPRRAARPEFKRFIVVCFKMFCAVVLALAVVLPTFLNARDDRWALFQLLMYSLFVGLVVCLTGRGD
jgi:L-asparagine transporter-like permease